MNDKSTSNLPAVAHIARVIAIAAWPAGILFGLALAAGQDAAGEGYAIVFGVLLALVISLLSTGLYFFARSEDRIRSVRRHGGKILTGLAIGAAVFLAWYLLPNFVEQRFSADIENRMSEDITNVEISVAGVAIELAALESNETIILDDLATRPRGPLTVRWINAANEAVVVTDGMTGGPPRWFDGGRLVVNILAEHEIHTYFVASKPD